MVSLCPPMCDAFDCFTVYLLTISKLELWVQQYVSHYSDSLQICANLDAFTIKTKTLNEEEAKTPFKRIARAEERKEVIPLNACHRINFMKWVISAPLVWDGSKNKKNIKKRIQFFLKEHSTFFGNRLILQLP